MSGLSVRGRFSLVLGFKPKGVSLASHKSSSSAVSRRREPALASGPSSAGSPGGIDPWILWVTFRRAWFWVIPLGLLLAVPAGYKVYIDFVPQYRATHLLAVNRDYVVFQGVLPGVGAESEARLISNAIVLDPVLSDLEVCKAPSLRNPESREKSLRKNLSVNVRGGFSVSYVDPDPEYAALVCNAVVDSYLRQRMAFDNQRLADLESWLRPAIDRWEGEVKGHQERIRELSQQAHGFDPASSVGRLENGTTVMTGLFNQLTHVKGDEELLRAKIDAAQARRDLGGDPISDADITPSPEDIDRFVASDPAVNRLQRRAQEKESQRRRMEDSDLVRINREWYNGLAKDLEVIEGELSQAREAARESALLYLAERASQQGALNRVRELASMQSELDSLVTKRETLERAFAEEKTRLEQFAGESVDLYFAQQQYRQAASILEKLNLRIASLRTERQRGATVQSLAPATLPPSPTQDLPMKKMLFMGGAAFCIPFALALLWELVVKRVTNPKAIEARHLAPVIGEVARLPVGAFGGGRKRIFEESVDTLRANLLLSSELAEVRSLAVTSSMSGEGKSSLASQLAVSIGKATGETVLLIDADLRSPDQHHLFGLDMGIGMAGVLAQRGTLDGAIDRSLGALVHVLPAGYLDASPHRLLSPSAIRDLIDHAINDLGYRYVLFDTAPVLAAGETLAITAEVDATLVCVMRDITRMDNLERTVKRLETTGASLAGTVFNGVPSREYAYRYGDYRYGELQRRKLEEVAVG